MRSSKSEFWFVFDNNPYRGRFSFLLRDTHFTHVFVVFRDNRLKRWCICEKNEYRIQFKFSDCEISRDFISILFKSMKSIQSIVHVVKNRKMTQKNYPITMFTCTSVAAHFAGIIGNYFTPTQLYRRLIKKCPTWDKSGIIHTQEVHRR